MALRDTYHASKDENGKTRYRGNPIKHRRGEPYLVDCNITGSDRGTPTNPKFALRDLWEYTLIPSIESMVEVGGPCEGAVVIFQEDNAGPHCDETYRNYLREQFEARQWKIELQAPQGELSIFSQYFFHLIIIEFIMFPCTRRPLHKRSRPIDLSNA